LHGGHVGECRAAAISRKIEMQLRTTVRRRVRALPASALLPRRAVEGNVVRTMMAGKGAGASAHQHCRTAAVSYMPRYYLALWQYRPREGKLAAGSGS
jgi:hypothetical protein